MHFGFDYAFDGFRMGEKYPGELWGRAWCCSMSLGSSALTKAECTPPYGGLRALKNMG